MTVKVQWRNPKKTLIQQTFKDLWTLEDYHDLVEETRTMLDNAQNTSVDLIVDLSESITLTADLLIAPESPERTEHECINRVIVVGASNLLKTMMKIDDQLVLWVGQHVFYVDTLEDAEDLALRPMAPKPFRMEPGNTRPLEYTGN